MYRIKGFISGVLILAASATIGSGLLGHISVYADTLGSGSQDYRINVLSAVGIVESKSDDDYTGTCTRAEFAKLLVLASPYSETSSSTSSSAAANDVPASYTGSGYIKTALTNGWMRTRLGGAFAPDQAVTLNDAAKACLAMLGYTDDDFKTNVTTERLEKFKSLELNEGVTATSGTDTLTRKDAINIIYNLLRTTSKDSQSIYGASLDLTLSSDSKELNATEAVTEALVGPILIKNVSEIATAIPFDEDEATFYYNGQNTLSAGMRYYRSHIESYGWLIVYYNEHTKSVWAYGTDTGNNTYHCVMGKVNAINYESENIASPSSVVIGNTTYSLSSSEVKFMFSMSGDITTGDDVVLICKDNTTTSSDDEDTTTYTAVAVVKYYEGSDSGLSNVIYATDASTYVVANNGGTISVGSSGIASSNE